MSEKEAVPPLFKRTHLPLLPGFLALSVADTITVATQVADKKHFKSKTEIDGNEMALCLSNQSGKFAVVFSRKELTHENIAHELHHAVCRICEYACVRPSHDNAETAAHLAGWLAAWIYKQLDKAGEKVISK